MRSNTWQTGRHGHARGQLRLGGARDGLRRLRGWQLSPVLASAAMSLSLSSVSVLLSSLRLRGFAR